MLRRLVGYVLSRMFPTKSMPFVLLSVSLAAVGIRVTPVPHIATPLPVRTWMAAVV